MPDTKQPPSKTMAYVGVAFVVAMIAFAAVALFQWVSSGSTPSQPQVAQAPAPAAPVQAPAPAPATSSGTAITSECPDFTTEVHQCQLEKAGTWISLSPSIGPGFHICYTPGADSAFDSRDYLDDTHGRPQPYDRNATGLRSIHFVPHEAGTILTYWVSRTPCP